MINDSDFIKATLTDATVHKILKSGGNLEDVVVALVNEKTELLGWLMAATTIAPKKIKTPDGKIMVWHCPDELIPLSE